MRLACPLKVAPYYLEWSNVYHSLSRRHSKIYAFSSVLRVVHVFVNNAVIIFLLDFFDYDALDDMGNRIDELEQSINELRAEMGVEGSPSPSAPARSPLQPIEPKSSE